MRYSTNGKLSIGESTSDLVQDDSSAIQGQNKTRVLLCKRLSGQCRDVYSVVYFHLHWWWCAVVGCTVLYWAVLVCAGLYLAVLECSGLYLVVLGSAGLYWAVVDFNELYCQGV